MRRSFYLVAGIASLGLAWIGIFLPLLPTVPFVILAAFCFARSSPALERRLVDHPRWGPHIRAWRDRGAISARGKRAAMLAFAASALIGVVALPFPIALVPIAAALIGGTWVMTRPA